MGDRRGRSHSIDRGGCQDSPKVTIRDVNWRILGAAFVLNLAWEMVQMFAYAGMSQVSGRAFIVCLGAALGDALYVMCVYWIGKAIRGPSLWICKLNMRSVIAISVFGILTAAGIERFGIAEGLWAYRNNMPLLPFHVGLWPVLQFMMTPILTFWVVRHWIHYEVRRRKRH